MFRCAQDANRSVVVTKVLPCSLKAFAISATPLGKRRGHAGQLPQVLPGLLSAGSDIFQALRPVTIELFVTLNRPVASGMA